MGARQSTETRSVSMDNPNPAGVIDVSEDVVHRLKMGIKKQVKENVSHESTASSKSSEPKEKLETLSDPVKPSVPEKPANAARAAATPLQRSSPSIYENTTPAYVQTPTGATMTALDVRRQKEIELQQNDTMWRQRLVHLEETLKKTNTVMEEEYSSAVEDVRKRFANASPVHQLPPCQDLKAQVIACYRSHPGETLECADVVDSFRNCVSEHRVKKLDDAAPMREKKPKFNIQPLSATAKDVSETAKAA